MERSQLCIPVTVLEWRHQKQHLEKRVLIRFPLPYRVGEDFRPGNGDEKIRCEAGTYAWIQENCPEIPIPRLYGFGMSSGETFTHVENFSILFRWIQYFRRRMLSFLGRTTPSKYVRHQIQNNLTRELNVGYLLIEYIEAREGTMLSSTWELKHNNPKLRANFFRDLGRIFLSLSRKPLQRIGSFAIDNNGFIHLQNRPLSLGIQELENERIPVDMPWNFTYSTVDSYVVDTLAYHDSRLYHQPNAINDTGDFIYQTSSLTTMRAIFSSFFRRDFRRGPFVLTLTDLHQSNIFVDENWHITSLIDLEWACSLPIEMLHPPYWLTGMAVDRIEPCEYNKSRLEFMDILTVEEKRDDRKGDSPFDFKLSEIINSAWDNGTFWYSLALSSPTGLFAIFDKEIQPRFTKTCPDYDSFHEIMPWYWTQQVLPIAKQKVEDKRSYDNKLKAEFNID
ncbi:conserved hypothetical protein [Talaromyces stipitatus ATCC 10500]|uniref:Aminoglycoside phosphotransferase domain-containing protein n=1 Tax=Talaromyces stipitatus (strain ATCC 10500 / CBS 375.48 / QM 6759 / NRRL 1006) TaxID=441959 RepID=B8MEX3_TALSN|nr:uncharacterized protein TSTA_023100 [Talaromyces stipitatus ATCC 10500]EED17256.1 conserved hypothetical protein [Talaromyces stipitatus ATCC 10500]